MNLFALYLFICVIYSLIKGLNYLDRELEFNILDFLLILSIPITILFIIYANVYKNNEHENHYTDI